MLNRYESVNMDLVEAAKFLNDNSIFPKAAANFKFLRSDELPVFRGISPQGESVVAACGFGTRSDTVKRPCTYRPPELVLSVSSNSIDDLLLAVANEEKVFLSRFKGTVLYMSTRGWLIRPEGVKFGAFACVSAVWG